MHESSDHDPVQALQGDRVLWRAAFTAAAAAAAALILWFGRDTTFTVDELVTFMDSPNLDLDTAFEPINGHLALTARLAYGFVLETFGSGYLPFRLLTIAMVIVTVALLYTYASRRVGRVVAFAPVPILLAFGSDYLHVLVGNGFAVLLSVAFGLAALLAVQRRDLPGDVAACVLLVLGVVTFSVALAFVVGVAVTVLLGHDRWRRAWIVAIPIALYGGWWLSSLGAAHGSGDQLDVANILLLPAWGFQALTSVLGALVGLDYDFSRAEVPSFAQTTETVALVGPVLAVAAILLVVQRVRVASVPSTLWAALAVLITLWAMGALVADPDRPPSSIRYLYPGAVVTLMVAADAVSGVRWSRGGLVALYAIAGFGLAVNLVQLRDGGQQLRDFDAHLMRSELGALQIAGEQAEPELNIGAIADGTSILTYPFAIADIGEPPTHAYLEAAERYGGIGYSLAELRESDEGDRSRADSVLIAALGLALTPPPQESPERCRELNPAVGERTSVVLPPAGIVVSSEGAAGPVEVRRFADASWLTIGELPAGARALIRAPRDRAPDPWHVSVPGRSALVCPVA